MMLPSSNQNIMVWILYEIDSVVQASVLAVVYNISSTPDSRLLPLNIRKHITER